MDYRLNPINDDGYRRLIEKIFDHPEWYHEYHDMIRTILAEAKRDHIKKYLGIERGTLRNYWATDAHEPDYEKYLLLIECYENL